jgi:hypothetical protein
VSTDGAAKSSDEWSGKMVETRRKLLFDELARFGRRAVLLLTEAEVSSVR